MTTVIYHSADFDGIFCREIARKFLGDKGVNYVGWNFGDSPVTVPEGTIYILDLPPDCLFTKGAEPNPEVWTGLFSRMIWIDHHKSSIDKGQATIPGYRIDGVAACRLCWQWFINSPPGICRVFTKDDFVKRVPEEPLAVRLAGEYDVCDKRDPDVDSFQNGMKSIPLTVGIWDELLKPKKFPRLVWSIIELGKVIRCRKPLPRSTPNGLTCNTLSF